MSIVHEPVNAPDLRPGDVIRIGVSENYILAYEVTRTGDDVAIWAYRDSGSQATSGLGPSLRFKASDQVLVSRRDYRPWETGHLLILEASPMSIRLKKSDEGTDYGWALVTGDAAGMAHATDLELMAHFCEYSLQHAVGAVSGRLVWEGARKAGMSARDLAKLAVDDPDAVHDLMWS